MGTEVEPQDSSPRKSIAEFAPSDYTDGRDLLDWQTKYPKEARKKYRFEAAYCFIILAIFTVAVFAALFFPNLFTPGDVCKNQRWISCICSWLGGTIGGTLFTIKWLYHSVAKKIWHEDRRLWRFFTPHVSGAIAFFTILLTTSGLAKIFSKELIEDAFAVLGIAFLIGYFSDKALAKLAEMADTLFGTIEKH